MKNQVLNRQNIRHVLQSLVIAVIQALTLLTLDHFMPGITFETRWSAVAILLGFAVFQAIFWWLFIHFFAHLPVWLYPLLTFGGAGLIFVYFANFIPGVRIHSVPEGMLFSLILTGVSGLFGGIFALDQDAQFDRFVTRHMVARYGNPQKTSTPGFLFLEIDGLAEKIFRRALDEGYLPTLKDMLENGSHRILPWETDFSSQTGAMQSGILLGNNHNVPAYRWWNRKTKKLVISGNPFDANEVERRLSSGRGLLDAGGSSRCNMFSGDAEESLFTFSTLMDSTRKLSPGFYLFFVSPFVVTRLCVRFIGQVFQEWGQALMQRIRRDPYRVNARNALYGLIRGFMGPVLQDLTTYTVIGDVLRGMPAIYALYAAYDDIGHFAGMDTPEAFGVLAETDRYFARIQHVLRFAPRPYYVIVLSDHGQSKGGAFQTKHGLTLERLVKGLIHDEHSVWAEERTAEAWDAINAVLNESLNPHTRTAAFLRRLVQSKTHRNWVAVQPDVAHRKAAEKAKVVVIGSGCAGLIYFTDYPERLTAESIADRYPDLIPGLVEHPGVGFVLVHSSQNGAMVIGKRGIHYLDDGKVEGEDPLAGYGERAAAHLRRECNFEDCADVVVNTAYDAETQILCGFENQSSHHGGLGGTQNHPFLFYPADLPAPTQPIVGAEAVYDLLYGWRTAVQRTDQRSEA